MAVAIGVGVALLELDRDHCHVRSEMSPSGSFRVASNTVPTCGCFHDKATVPGSSTSLTLMVTVILSLAPDGSVAITFTV